MDVIRCRNVNDGYVDGLRLLNYQGERQPSRAGEVLVSPYPLTVIYNRPQERVLFDAARDANPFFHLFESLWMLAGRNDGHWLDFFVKDFSARFGEYDGIIHGAYGHRWRKAFGFDQLNEVVHKLRHNPQDRQAVIQMWDCSPDRVSIREGDIPTHGQDDLLGDFRDRPCNTHVYLRVYTRRHLTDELKGITEPLDQELDITVCCRSNDAVWGTFGANAVHFSVLQEYLAARLNVGVGRYYQVANNFHVYTDVLEKVGTPLVKFDDYDLDRVKPTLIVTEPNSFDHELADFLRDLDNAVDPSAADLSMEGTKWENEFFPTVAWPMYRAYKLWREKEYIEARRMLATMPEESDWGLAAKQWLDRRTVKRKGQVNVSSE